MKPLYCPICFNYQGDFKCNAFPERIPDNYFVGEADPKNCGNGFQFENLLEDFIE
jgi:hypothetical protein